MCGPALTGLGDLNPGTPAFNLWVGLLFFIPVAIGGVFGLLGGHLTDLLGRRRVLVGAIAVCLLGVRGKLCRVGAELVFFRAGCGDRRERRKCGCARGAGGAVPPPTQRESAAPTPRPATQGRPDGRGARPRRHLRGTIPTIREGHEAWRYTALRNHSCGSAHLSFGHFWPNGRSGERKNPGALKRPRMPGALPPCTTKDHPDRHYRWRVYCPGVWSATAYRSDRPRACRSAKSRTATGKAKGQQRKMFKELGSLTGRAIFALLIVRVVTQRRRLRICFGPMLIAISWLSICAATHSLALLRHGVFLATLLFTRLHSFWGNYLPRVYQTPL